ncbi:MAG: hypothetical protein KGL44_07515 [Sphingomonadales bacterium]|nr:hypothetical protein [Sphingomonadales bacterium]
MKPESWPCPLPDGGTTAEQVFACDRGRAFRLLIVPALFDEANKLRRFAVEVLRRLDGAGIDAFLPDLPGCNESLQALDDQTPAHWRAAMQVAASHVRATHVLGLRGGALVMPAGLPGWRYAPVNGASVLRQMLRARIVAAREAGRDETVDGLLDTGLAEGLDLAGYRLSGAFLREFQSLQPAVAVAVSDIEQDMLGGGGGLWLRAEPDFDKAQADALAAIVALGMKA